MNKQTQEIAHELGQLAEHSRGLLAATTDVAGEKVVEARKRLAATLESGKEICGRVRDKAAYVPHSPGEARPARQPKQWIDAPVAVGIVGA